MYCSSCGKEIPSDARFCVHCGAPTAVPAAAMPMPSFSGLFRSRSQRMIAGVCGGLAQTYGWDVTIVRLVTALLIFFTGIPVFVYFAAWIIVPEEPIVFPMTPPPPPPAAQTE
jgi:phage shock protein C